MSIEVIDVGRPSLLWVAPFPKQGVLNYLRVKASEKAVCMYLLLSALDYRCDASSCHCDSPGTVGRNQPLLPKSLFGGIFRGYFIIATEK